MVIFGYNMPYEEQAKINLWIKKAELVIKIKECLLSTNN